MAKDTIAKKVILEELEEQAHPEPVEDVIFWALEFYAENKKDQSWGKTIAAAIVQNIKDTEREVRTKSN